jgi:hypothetical protein
MRSPRRILLAVAAIVVVGVVAFLIVTYVNHLATRSGQQQSLASANTALATQFTSYAHRTSACEKVANPYRCIERADAAMAPHLDLYVRVVKRATASGISQNLIDHAEADGQRAARAFQVIGAAAPTKVGYTKAVNQTGIFRLVHGLEDSVNALSARLS